MRLLRSTLFNVCFYVLSIILMLAALPALARGGDAVESHARRWARSTIVLLDHICGRQRRISRDGKFAGCPVIVAAKHQSTLDVFVLLLAVTRFTFIYKRELDFLPLFGAYLRGCGQISIDRSKRVGVLSQIVTAAKAKFAENRRLIIFPEGTRRPVGAAPGLYGGVARIVEATGVVCVPGGAQFRAFLAAPSFHSPARAGWWWNFCRRFRRGSTRQFHADFADADRDPATDRLVAEAVDRDAGLAPSAPKLGFPGS